MANDFEKYYKTFSGTDMVASIVFPGCQPIVIGELATISYSEYRETHPVRTLSRITVKGFTKGARTVAGTMIFTVFDQHIVNRLRTEVPYLANLIKIKADELPPFDIFVTMGNEYGASARLNIYGLTIVDEGKVLSIEDLFTENQWSYMARSVDLLDALGAEQNKDITVLRKDDEATGAFKVSDLVLDNTYDKMMADLKAYKDAQIAKVAAERAAELKKYTYNIPDLSYKPEIVVDSDTGNPNDPNKVLDPEDAAHIYDVNHPKLVMTTRYFSDGVDAIVKDTTQDLAAEFKSGNAKTRSILVYADVEDYVGDNGIVGGVTMGVNVEFNGKSNFLGNAVIGNAGHVIIDIEHYYEWTPEIPTIKIWVGDHKNLRNRGGKNWVLISGDSKTVSNDGQGVYGAEPANEIRFTYAQEGSKAAQNANLYKGAIIGLTAKAIGCTESHGRAGWADTTIIFKDASKGEKDSKGNYKVGDWVTPSFVEHRNGLYDFTIYVGANPDKADGGFHFTIDSVVDADRNDISKKIDMDKITITADVKIQYKPAGEGEPIIINGLAANYNRQLPVPEDKRLYYGALTIDGDDCEGKGTDVHIFNDTPLINTGLFGISMFGGIDEFAWTAMGSTLQGGLNEAMLEAVFYNFQAYAKPFNDSPIPMKCNCIPSELTVKVGVIADAENALKYLQ